MSVSTSVPPVRDAPTVAATASRPRKRTLRQGATGWVFAVPTAAFVVALFLVPLFIVLRMSASDWSLLGGNQGLDFPANYRDAVHVQFFVDSLIFTAKYTVLATVLLLGLGLGMALIVQEASRWSTFLRTAWLVPGALGLASASLLFYTLYSPVTGPFAGFMDRHHLSFLGSPTSALFSTTFLIVWRFAGFYMLLMLVGLQAIPGEVFEAARIDGANRRQTFRWVTIPLLRPTLALTTVLCVTGSMLAFEQFYILTKGGPDNSTITLVQLIYSVAFQGRNDLGVAAALSVIALLVLVLINLVQIRLLRSPDE